MSQKRPLTFSLFFLRLLSGMAGGVVGILVAFVVFFLMQTVVPSDDSNSLTIFTIILMAFAATLTANMTVAAMSSFMDEEKYHRRKTILIHVLVFNILLFLVTIPLYILGTAADIVRTIAALHFLLAAFVTSLIMEILAGYQYVLLGVYTSSLAIFISIGLSMLLRIDKLESLLLFGTMPIVWLLLEATNGFGELVYDTFLKWYGLDALSTSTDLGGDDEVEDPSDEVKDQEASAETTTKESPDKTLPKKQRITQSSSQEAKIDPSKKEEAPEPNPTQNEADGANNQSSET